MLVEEVGKRANGAIRMIGEEMFISFKKITDLAVLHLSCGMWDIVPRPGTEPKPPCTGASICNTGRHRGSGLEQSLIFPVLEETEFENH